MDTGTEKKVSQTNMAGMLLLNIVYDKMIRIFFKEDN